MPQYFTHYWMNQTWFEHQYRESGAPLNHIAGNLFTKRGVEDGDVIYVVTNLSGRLYLCGKMAVGRICDAHEAAQHLGCKPSDLWKASEHILASEATPMRFDLAVSLPLTVRLRFKAGKHSKALTFNVPGCLDNQTLRGVRALEESSALLLDELLPPMKEVL